MFPAVGGTWWWSALLVPIGGFTCIWGSYRALGQDDIKLLMAFGALQGPGFLLLALAYGALIGGIMAVVVALHRGLLAKTFKNLGASIYLRAAGVAPMDMADAAEASGEVRLPYAIALGLGAITTLVVRELL